MLVTDPAKRYTVELIKRHRWMQAEVPPSQRQKAAAAAAATAAATTDSPVKSGKKSDVPINEGLMKVMSDLGIDTNITREVIYVSSSRSRPLSNDAFFCTRPLPFCRWEHIRTT